MKVIDVGASPGGWTQYLAEKGCQVFSIDPAPLTLSEEFNDKYVWLKGLSSNEEVVKRLKEEGPFDMIVSDMNQLPDELVCCFCVCILSLLSYIRQEDLMI